MKHFLIILIAIAFIQCNSKDEKDNSDQPNSETLENTTETPTEKATIDDIDKIKNVLPEGFELVKSDEGESLIFAKLNNDDYTDAVALIVKGNNLIEYDFENEVKLAIFLGDDNGFELFNMSGDFGGETIIAMGSKHIDVKNKVISYFHQSMRHDLELKFRYEKKYDDIMLIGKESNNYGNAAGDGSGNISIDYLSGLMIKNLNEADYESGELKELPEEKIKFNQPLKSISDVDYETMYDNL